MLRRASLPCVGTDTQEHIGRTDDLFLDKKAQPSRRLSHWWRQGMMGGAKAYYDGIVAFSQTDFTDDLRKINVPALVMQTTIRSFHAH
jgi:hypothetical protein